MDEVESRLGRVEGKQEGLETYLPALLGRFERMEERLSGEVKALSRKIDVDLQAFSDKVDRRIQALDDKVDHRLQALDDKVDRRIQSLDDKVDRQSALNRWQQWALIIAVAAVPVSIFVAALT